MTKKRQIVLCADDNPEDQMLVLDILLELDPSIRVASALNGVEAMSFLYGARQRGELPCLVILDINIPLMDGKQALTLIKKDKELAEVPVVLFTTSSSEMDKSFALYHGVEFITKPVRHGELYHSVKRLLSRHMY